MADTITGEEMKLPSRGWGPWRREFYSLYSTTRQIEADVNHEHGEWVNVWTHQADSMVYALCYQLWHWWHNRPNSKSRRAIEKHFPKLRG